MNKIPFALAILIVGLTCTISSCELAQEYPAMRPTPEEASIWVALYESSPDAPGTTSAPSDLQLFSETYYMGSSFTLLNYLQYNPSDRNQGSCENCWAWAGTGAMEIDLAYNKNIKDRLSVQYLNSNVPNHCCRGWINQVVDFYASTGKAVPWTNNNAGWQDSSCSCGNSIVPASSIATSPDYPISFIQAEKVPTQGCGKEVAINNIKTVLNQGKAVWFCFFVPNGGEWSKFCNFWSSQPESAVWQPDTACGLSYANYTGCGHAVLCVGYDETDINNRYWIMLNSWGTTPARPNGLFRVNMDMNYDCHYPGFGRAFFFQTLKIEYADRGLTPAPPCSGRIDVYVFDANTMSGVSTATVEYYKDVNNYISVEGDSGNHYVIGPASFFCPYSTYSITCTAPGYNSASATVDTDATGYAICNFYLQPIITPVPTPPGSEPEIQIVTQAVDPVTNRVYYSYNPSGLQVFQIKVLVIGPDIFNIRSVHYQLHPTFSPSEYTSTDPYNNFGLELWTWGAFNMPITVTMKDGRVYEYDYFFTFGDQLRDAQRRGIPFVQVM